MSGGTGEPAAPASDAENIGQPERGQGEDGPAPQQEGDPAASPEGSNEAPLSVAEACSSPANQGRTSPEESSPQPQGNPTDPPTTEGDPSSTEADAPCKQLDSEAAANGPNTAIAEEVSGDLHPKLPQATAATDEPNQSTATHSDPNKETTDGNPVPTGEDLKSESERPAAELKAEHSAASGAQGYEGLIGTESAVTQATEPKSPRTPVGTGSAASPSLNAASPSCSSASAMHHASPAAGGPSSPEGRHPLDTETRRMTDKQAHVEAIRLQNATIKAMVKCSSSVAQFNRASEQNFPAMKTSFDRHSTMLSSLSKDLVTIDVMLHNIRQRMTALGARPLEERKEE